MKRMKLDLAKYEVFYHKLDQILDEGKEVVRYLSGSTITREAGEVVVAYYNLDGNAADIACGILIHILNITRCIKYMEAQDYAASIGINEGDIFINNDAHIGGAHVPDTGIVLPFYYKGKHIGYVAAMSHTTEVGAIDPGGMSPRATETYHDGLTLPCIKLGEKGVLRKDLMNMIFRSTRDARGTELDIKARLAGCERTTKRLTEVIDEVGVDFFQAATAQMVEDAALEARSKIKTLRPGIYSSRLYIDNAGAGIDKIAIVQLDMEVTENGELILNFPIVSPQVRGPNNSYLPGVESQLMVVLLERLFYDLRWNTGVARHMKLVTPASSRINADANMSVAMGVVNLALPVTNLLQETISRALYIIGEEEEVDAPSNETANCMVFSGLDLYGRPNVNILMSVAGQAGSGGRINKDGIDSSVQRYNPWSYTSDGESEEMLTPVLWLTQRHLPDSGGFGKHRGGLSTYNMVVVYKGSEVFGMSVGAAFKLAIGQGLFGGYPAAASGYTVCKDTDLLELMNKGEPIPHDEEEIKDWLRERKTLSWMYYLEPELKKGDAVIQVGVPGAGLGDPLERDPDLIVEDIRNKMGTLQMAQKAYGVVVDPKTLKVNYAETKRLREERREERLNRGIPGREYLKKLVQQRKKRELPKEALEFLDETIAFSPAYKAQLEIEEKMLEKEFGPLGTVRAVKDVLNLSPYVKIVEDENRSKVIICRQCGFGYCDSAENFKLHCLVYERDPAELQVGFYSYDKDWCIYREFYCPGCGTQVEVEATPPGTPILQSVRLKNI